MALEIDWELISTVSGDNCLYEVDRTKVPGGWIVRSRAYFGDEDMAVPHGAWKRSSESMVFVKDETHSWGFNIMESAIYER